MNITIQNFKNSIQSGELPSGIPPHIQALWHDGRGDWEKAHSLIDHLDDPVSSHIHAYLHRKEGDTWNADYWYRKAGKSRPDFSLEQEWEHLLSLYLD
jgi:hypothetical protein